MISLRIRATLGAAALALLAFPTPAQARPAAPDSQLRLTVVSANGSPLGSAELRCHPSGGDHPQAAAACAALDRSGGDLDRLAGTTGTLCYQLYAPVTASASGHWLDREVRWHQQFGNICELHSRTDPAFRL
ncbi:SSI family serine proteinase inhibitor [Kitasatospora viridis]|uniref:SSI family serine proteinase inhibitor n=1 Tax=Kitasatospora viridis TaxID=281105 RepID=UPI001478A523|nr:SSI family serine proteinase inhibitor [Kitasatospora viridis]